VTTMSWSGVDSLLLKRVDDRQERLNSLQPWPAKAAERLWEGLLPDWIAGVNGMDGNRLTPAETATFLADGVTFSDRSLREHLEALNARDAVALLRRLARESSSLKAATVRRLHAKLVAGVDDAFGGEYRRQPIEQDGKAGPVADQMRSWEIWLAGSARALHPAERATAAHHRLIQMQPFFDGNGRTARFAMSLMLMRDGYLPAILRSEQRHDYRQALYRADAGDYRLLVRLVVGAIEHVQTVYLMALER
jgi:Fic family protein